MASKNQIKLVKSLGRKKNRRELGLFVAEGRKIVAEGLHSGLEAEMLFCLNSVSGQEEFQKAQAIDEETMSRLTLLSNPSEALAVFKIPAGIENPKPEQLLERCQSSPLLLYLDEIKDPGNLGTLIRIADWFGMPALLCSETSVDTFNPKTVQSAMGSLFRLPVYRLGKELLQSSVGNSREIYTADLDGTSIWEIPRASERPAVVIIGSESHGPGADAFALSSHRITIPGSGSAESLNAAVSGGIISAALLR